MAYIPLESLCSLVPLVEKITANKQQNSIEARVIGVM